MISLAGVNRTRNIERVNQRLLGLLPFALWSIRTCLYAWLAPWMVMAVCWTMFRPGVESIRDVVIEAATKNPAAWTTSNLPQMWWTIQLVCAVMVVAFRLPSLLVGSVVTEHVLDWISLRLGQLWKRLDRTIKLIALAVALDLGLWLVFSHHGSGHKELVDMSVSQATNEAGAALLLPDGTARSGTAEVRQQDGDKSTYIVRFVNQGSESRGTSK